MILDWLVFFWYSMWKMVEEEMGGEWKGGEGEGRGSE